MKELLDKIDKKIEEETLKIEQYINKNELFQSDIFDKPVIVRTTPQLGSPLRGKHGIYLFVMEHAFTLENRQVWHWNEDVHGAGFRDYGLSFINEGDCLYLGSCISKSLYSRIREHFSASGTFSALKLTHPSRNFLGEDVYCAAFPLKKGYSDFHTRVLLPAIEKRLHEKMVPLCGSSRV